MTKNVVSASPTSQKLFELLRRFPERLELFPGLPCCKLKAKILKKYSSVFKDKLGPEDRVKLPDVKLELDETRKCRTPADIPIYMRPATVEEFRN